MMQNNDENRNIGENIRLYRIRAGLTVKELSKRIHRHHQLVIKPGSIRNYEKGTEKIPAVALNSIAAITRTDIREFYEPAHPAILLDTSQKLHLLEAFSLIIEEITDWYFIRANDNRNLSTAFIHSRDFEFLGCPEFQVILSPDISIVMNKTKIYLIF